MANATFPAGAAWARVIEIAHNVEAQEKSLVSCASEVNASTVAAAEGVRKTEFSPPITRAVDPEPEPTIRASGEVRRSDEDWNPYLV